MDNIINTRPLLQRSDTDSDFDEDVVGPNKDNIEVDENYVADNKPLFNSWEPTDRYNLGFLIFSFLGIIILLPWYFFVTAEEYWMYKFRPLHANLTLKENDISELQISFTSYMTFAATVPSTFILIITPVINPRIPLNIRVIGSLVTMLILFIITTIFVKINTDTWQEQFFMVTLVIVVLLNIASAILQSAIFGVAGRFPSRFIAGTVSGQAFGGIIAAIAEIISLTVGASPIFSAFVYFIIADIFMLIAILSYIFLASTLFFKYHNKEIVKQGSIQYKPVNSVDKELQNVPDISYTGILGKIWVHGMSLAYCFVVMLCVYPSITVLVKPVNTEHTEWNDTFFVPVITFLLYNCCDYTGRIISGYLKWPEKDSWIIATLSIVRTIFIPLVMMCNAQPREHLPVLINSDWLYILIIILFGFTTGYLANINFVSVPKIVAEHEQEIASTMLAAFLGVGIACGSVLSLLFVNLL